MSPTDNDNIHLSNAEIEALAAEIQGVSSKERMLIRPTLQALLLHIRTSADASLFEIVRTWLSELKLTKGVVKINASDTTESKITEVFEIKVNKRNRWTLAEDSLVEVPSMLKRNVRDLEDALYDEDSEATCRIAVDIMLVQCRKYLRHKYQSAETACRIDANVANATNPSTHTKAVDMPAAEPIKRVKLFPESSLSIEMRNKLIPNGKILVTGRADWAMGYSTAGDEGTLLVAMEAKERSEFSKGEAQLIAYLAILREHRLRARKTNIITQGFYSDGMRFTFICITADGIIEKSAIFEINFERDLKIVFNFIVTMMETAMKSTPNATPTKPGQLQEKEVNHYKDEVWLKVYALVKESVAICPDDDMEDAFDVSRI